MTIRSFDEQAALLARGADQIYTSTELLERLKTGWPLRVKLGMDPTAPDLTLGHSVVLGKLRQFQDLGHTAVLIIGDYTAKIGDPTGRSKTRPPLDDDAIRTNAATYFDQAGKILDLSPEKLEIRYNGEWLAKLNFADVIRLMSTMTTARMLERDTFAKRHHAGKEIFLHELLYPLMQAYDSVMVRSDVELGGTDQTFNNLCGRDLQRVNGQPPQIVLIMPILVGLDGTQKMSKSLGNYVAFTDAPSDMYGKIMSIPDALMANWFTLLTDETTERIAEWTDPARSHPREAKDRLAMHVVAKFHGSEKAQRASEEFRRIFAGGELPDEMEEVSLPASALAQNRIAPVELVKLCGFAETGGEARRLIKEGGVRLNGEAVADFQKPVEVHHGDVVQRGKRRFIRLVISA